ncbi:AAA family ATPase [Anaerostipes sp. 494a]|uniref:SF1B family DNA helicase RecD2 n=1 Tax=Anaerostipes sp. 494a TaxID=1261636 RepID=UPI000951190C|nr:ATP-dependent RecD-like DNA helicase [Anaerostipes sp. 494a]OLR59776.1 AAA family ATPase [Anaerostipes sp. 494a]
MEHLEGYVDHIRFRNENNGYTVLSLDVEDDEETVVGLFPFLNEGEYISMEGEYVDHSVHGPQFQMKTYEITAPDDIHSMERYLGSGAIKGVGPATAKKIVKKFKMDTFRIIEEEPERLAEIKGITDKKAQMIAVEFNEKQEMRHAMMFLSGYGINNNLAVKIYKEYGDHLYTIIQENPYRMTDDIAGVGFKIADEIAKKVGIGSDSDYRIISGIFYTLMQALNEGHIYLPKHILCRNAAYILGVGEEAIEEHLLGMMIDKKIVIVEEEEIRIYGAAQYHMEVNTARMLCDLNLHYDVSVSEIETMIAGIEEAEQITFANKQKEAIEAIASHSIVILTGGPGTGKTTTINGMIQYFEREGLDIRLAAPTGRAAKRMTEATGYEAMTIHRLLEINGEAERDLNHGGMPFERNSANPLETDVVIIDEMSMVDLYLMNALLQAMVPGTRLVMVGDANQLPSIGAGNVLKDMISSKEFKVVELNQIFRQEEGSHIVRNAHLIHQGRTVELDNKSRDFFFLQRNSVQDVLGVLVYLVRDKLPAYVNAEPYDIQILTPMRKGELGVERLNQVMQQYLNPPDKEKKEKDTSFGVFREGDKVMQIKNNYQQEWEIRNKKGFTVDKGVGVFNGDIGIITEINDFTEKVTVVFDDTREVQYGYASLDELELAYAITIHKSQGSEYPAVVMPLLTGPRVLFHRNLLYTGVTRARNCLTIVGDRGTLFSMIQNVNEQRRYSTLTKRIQEIAGESEENPFDEGWIE